MARSLRYDDEEGENDIASTLIPYNNVPALVGYYLGVFSLIPCLGLLLGPAAVILGFIGLRKSSQQPRKKGLGHAIAALVMGGLASLGNYGAILFMALAIAMGK